MNIKFSPELNNIRQTEPPEGQENEYVIQEEDLKVRKKIVEILDKIEVKFAYSDKLLQNELNPFKIEDRNLATEIVHGTMRWRERLDWYVGNLYNGNFNDLILTVKNILRSALYQLIFLDRVPDYAVLNESVEVAKQRFNQKTANLVNAILRNYIRQEKKLAWIETQLNILDKISIRLSHPRWLVQRWIEFWGVDHVESLCRSNNLRPEMFVRMNPLKTVTAGFEKVLQRTGIEYEIEKRLPDFYKIKNFHKFKEEKLLESGYAIMQDLSAALPVILINPKEGELIWDMCAAPGGKTAHMGILSENKAHIIAGDLYFNRVKLIKNTSQNVGLGHVHCLVGDSIEQHFNQKFDKILLDAPCSGLGVLRRRSDLRWKKTPQDIDDLTKIQYSLLQKAAISLKNGGELVYSTCSIDLEENDKVIKKFLKNYANFKLIRADERIPGPWVDEKGYIRTFPHLHNMDGSFAALFRKY
ncbi:MAG: 16S rRNA (cytosine(967)-C(5))-methyltransferase RsmB [Calditrichia bacterium]|nr:16S rRNA (cytosine(967)-C(5))-methyltransferase RsmB [Calditrichia bacterium]